MANLTPTNEEFVDSSYNNDPRLSQPSSGVRQVRNVQTDKRYDPDKRRGGAEKQSASTWGASMQAGEDRVEKEKKQRTQAAGIRSVAATKYQIAKQKVARLHKSHTLAQKRVRGKKGKGLKSVAGNITSRSITLSIWSWGFFIWLWFQLPFTLLSIVFMAVTETIYQFLIVLEPAVDDGWFATGIKGAGSVVTDYYAWVYGKVLTVFGYNIEALNPANLFVLTHVLLILVGWGMLLAIGIIYTMTGQKAFSGQGAAGKNAMFILALFGYALPLVNILPLFFFWTLMVLKNPR